MVSAFISIAPLLCIGVPTSVNIPSTGVSSSSGVLLLSAFPDVPVLSCAAVGPTAVDVFGILAESKISAFAAIPSALDVPSVVEVPSASSDSKVSGVPAVAIVPALLLPAVACNPILLLIIHLFRFW